MTRVTLAVAKVTAQVARRTITGTATVYGQRCSASVPLVIESGALRWADDVSRVKLLIDHDHTQPVGYATAIEDGPESLTITFHVPEGEAGDRALADASDGLRDGLSVGVWPDDDGYTWDDDGYMHITSGVLRETSLCAIPAVDDARVFDVAATTTGRNPMDPETTETTPAVVAATTPPTPPTPEPAPAPQAAPVAPPIAATGRRVSLRTAAQVTAAVVASGGTAADVRAALADITPANLTPATAEDPWLRNTWLGELWTASRVVRPWIDLGGTPRPITGTKVYGYKWETKPQVGDYAGNKAEIPTNKPKIVPAEAGVERIAGGWDIDRVYVDLGDASLIEALWAAAVEDYRAKSEAKVSALLRAKATSAGAAANLPDALVKLGLVAAEAGASIGGVGLAPDVWTAFASLTRDQVPWWVGAGSLNLGTAEGQVGDGAPRFFVDPSLPAGGFMAADPRAYTVFEHTPPVRVNAVDLPKGGLDLGLFGYIGLIVNDPRFVITGTVGAPATA